VEHSRTGKRAVRTAWIGLPLLPLMFLAFSDWHRICDRVDAIWNQREQTPSVAADVPVPPSPVAHADALPPGVNEERPILPAANASGLTVISTQDLSGQR
jgi:hypothetical protein